MRMDIRPLFLAALLFFIVTVSAEAQYSFKRSNTMVGVRAGTSLGGSVKRFISDQAALELMVFKRWGGMNYVLLFEHHMDIREFRGMEWYLGGGVHYGTWKLGKSEPPWVYKATQDYKAYGVDAVVGLEYNFNGTNFYLSLDWKPAYNFVDFTDLWWDEASFTLRYAF
jgi:hypothetical protein